MDIDIERTSTTPVYLQIYEQIHRRILSGELAAGDALPPERKLAADIGVNRSTVLSAYNRLRQESLIESRVGQGTVVSGKTVGQAGRKGTFWTQIASGGGNSAGSRLIQQMFQMLGRKDLISFALGMADPALIPELPLAALASKCASDSSTLSQSPVAGNAEFRETISAMLLREGVRCGKDRIMVLSGSQQGIDFAARVLIRPDDVVFVEAPCYFLALQSFRAAGARIVEIPSDDDGMNTDALESLLRRYQPACIYTVPDFRNPSTRTMTLERRMKLLDLAQRGGFVIVEDAAYSGLTFDGGKIPSLYELDTAGIVVYLRTFSKTICSGLRLGFMAAPAEMIEMCCRIRQISDIHPNTVSQHLVNGFIQSGGYDAHCDRIRIEYTRKCNLMHAALTRSAPADLLWKKPDGGFYIWCELPDGVIATELLALCVNEGLAFMPGGSFLRCG